MLTLLASMALPSPVQEPAGISRAILNLVADDQVVRADARRFLLDRRAAAIPLLVNGRLTREPRLRVVIGTMLDELLEYRIDRFELEDVTLAEAGGALERAFGVPVRTSGTAKLRISLALEDVGFWDAVLAVCDEARVGLEPSSHGAVATAEAEAVRIGVEWHDPATIYAADGPVLVAARARAHARERRGVLDLELRLAPGLCPIASLEPRLVEGRDFER